MPANRRSPGGEDWSKPVLLGGGWRMQYHKETGEDFTHVRLIPPPGTCPANVEAVAPRISTLDALRVIPWLQRIFKGPEGTRIFRPVACGEAGALDRAIRSLRSVDRQAGMELDRAPSLPPPPQRSRAGRTSSGR